ncbi:MAG: hypothetical protein WBE20_00325 [Candidatus Acidiferrales bacterium]
MQKIFRVSRDSVDQRIVRGNADGIILRQFTAGHAAESQQARGMTYRFFRIAVDFHLETAQSRLFIAKDQNIGLLQTSFFLLFFLFRFFGLENPA